MTGDHSLLIIKLSLALCLCLCSFALALEAKAGTAGGGFAAADAGLRARRLQLAVDETVNLGSASTSVTVPQYVANSDSTQYIVQISPTIVADASVACTLDCTSIGAVDGVAATATLNLKYGSVQTDVITDTSNSRAVATGTTCPISTTEQTSGSTSTQTLYVGVAVTAPAPDQPASMSGATITCTSPVTPAPTSAPTVLSPAPTPFPSPAPSVAPTCECFSESATVQALITDDDSEETTQPPTTSPPSRRRYHKTVAMEDLKVGQKVFAGYRQTEEGWWSWSGLLLVGRLLLGREATVTKVTPKKMTPIYETVYGFGHRNAERRDEYLQITTTKTSSYEHQLQPLEISASHLIFLHGKEHPVRADSLVVGDQLIHVNAVKYALDGSGATEARTQHHHHTAAAATTITKIERVTRRGLYQPLTKDGTILVDGIKTSTYISLSEVAPRTVRFGRTYFGFASEHDAFHWCIAPYRFVCTKVVAPRFCSNNDYKTDDDGINQYLSFAKSAMLAGEKHLPPWLMIVYDLLILSFCGIFVFLDNVLEGHVWSMIIAVAVLLLGKSYYYKLSQRRSLLSSQPTKPKPSLRGRKAKAE